MDRNFAIAIVLSVIIIVAFQYLFPTTPHHPVHKPPVPTEAAQGPQPAPRETEVKATKPPEPEAAAQVAKPTAAPASQAKEVHVKIDTLKYEAILTSAGARLISFKLKDYKVAHDSPELVNLDEPGGPDTGGPSIMFTGKDEPFDDRPFAYTCDSSDTHVTLNDKGTEKAVTFHTTTSDGLRISKTFTFHADNYVVGFSFTLTNQSDEKRNYLITLPWRKVYRGEQPNQRLSWNSAEILLNGELRDYYFKSIKGDEEPSGRVEWAGLGDVYFFKALVFEKSPASKVTLLQPSRDGYAEIRVRYGEVDLPKGKPVDTNLGLYLGPKEHSALEVAGYNLNKALYYSNYRVLDVISEYLMVFLRFCNSGFQMAGINFPGTHNYGWTIILLTILIKVLFIPLTHKSMKSMKRMQDLQPQLAKIKEKHKNDKVAQNKATMDLFREHKANPLGGCLPMLLQMPVFIALYQALSYAIELRHAHFLCIPSIYVCLNDLSGPGPYYVTPILMGGTMALQQWMTPSGGDPTQKKMMMAMPVVFTYIFLSLPSGLVLYWLVSNVLSIAQQVITIRTDSSKKLVPVPEVLTKSETGSEEATETPEETQKRTGGKSKKK